MQVVLVARRDNLFRIVTVGRRTKQAPCGLQQFEGLPIFFLGIGAGQADIKKLLIRKC